MIKYDYYLAYDDGNILIRDTDEMIPIQRYNEEKDEWVDDFDMCGIYSGDIPAKVITEKEASEIINSN
jgi:hypothetical protein